MAPGLEQGGPGSHEQETIKKKNKIMTQNTAQVSKWTNTKETKN